MRIRGPGLRRSPECETVHSVVQPSADILPTRDDTPLRLAVTLSPANVGHLRDTVSGSVRPARRRKTFRAAETALLHESVRAAAIRAPCPSCSVALPVVGDPGLDSLWSGTSVDSCPAARLDWRLKRAIGPSGLRAFIASKPTQPQVRAAPNAAERAASASAIRQGWISGSRFRLARPPGIHQGDGGPQVSALV